MKKYLLISLLAILSVNTFSQEFRFLAFTDYFGQIEPSTDYESVRQRNYIRPEFSTHILDYLGYFTISGEIYYDYFNDNEMPDPWNILRECYFSFYPSWGDIILGQKYTNKGKVDVFSPLNTFNASYKELFSLDEPYQSKRPDLQLEVNYYLTDESSLEVVYIPFPRPDYQSPGDLSFEADNGTYKLDKDSTPYLTGDPHSVFLTYNYYGYNFDLQGLYSFYTEQAYNYDLKNLSNGEISKEYNKVHTFGGAISTSIYEFGIVEEIAFNLTEDFNGNKSGVKNSDITLNTQLTKTLFGRTYGQINMVYQHVFNYKKASNDLEEAVYDAQLQPTDNILFLIGHLHDSFLREKLYLALNIGFFFSPDVYIAPRCNYKINDFLTLESGLDIYTGKYESKLLEEHLGGDTFFLRIKYEL